MKQILICHMGALGDFILTWPVIRALRDFLPGYSFTVLGHSEYCQLARRLGLIHRYYDRESREFSRFFMGTEIPAIFGKPDSAILWLNEARSIAGLLEAQGCHPVMTIPPVPVNDQHITTGYFEKVKVFFPIHPPINYYSLSQNRSIFPGLILIHAGSGSVKKNYPLNFYLDLADELKKSGMNHIRLLIGPAEQERGFPKNTGEFSIERPQTIIKLADLLQHVSLFIGNDSGVSHLAGILGIPTIAFYKVTSPRLWGVIGKNVVNIEAPDEKTATQKVLPILSALTRIGLEKIHLPDYG